MCVDDDDVVIIDLKLSLETRLLLRKSIIRIRESIVIVAMMAPPF